MSFWESILKIFHTEMEIPGLYGWYHILWLLLTAGASVALCLWHKKKGQTPVAKVLLWTAIVVLVLEVYKQVTFSFIPSDNTHFDYQWYAFPFQFCSTPMYVSLLAGLTKKGKFHDAMCAYLATFSMFAGLCVMFYPGDVFCTLAGVNIQTMICHGSMVVIGVYLLYSGHVKLSHKTILKAAIVFASCVAIACVMNEIAHASGLLERETFNMFFVSPYVAPSLPVYSLVQNVVPFPISLVIYILGFTLASYIILLSAMGISRMGKKKAAV